MFVVVISSPQNVYVWHEHFRQVLPSLDKHVDWKEESIRVIYQRRGDHYEKRIGSHFKGGMKKRKSRRYKDSRLFLLSFRNPFTALKSGMCCICIQNFRFADAFTQVLFPRDDDSTRGAIQIEMSS
jgi:hypothetical protein